MNSECARAQLYDLAGCTTVDRVLDVSEIVLAAAERIDRRTNRRPARNAAHARKSRIFPVGKGVVIGRQDPGGWIVRRRSARWRRIRRPLCVEGHVCGTQGQRAAGSISRAAAIGGGVPTGERVAGAYQVS